MRLPIRVAVPLLIVVFTATGCPRYTTQLTYTIGAGEVQRINISKPDHAQKINVAVSSPGSPVSVYVILEEHAEAAQRALLMNQEPDLGTVLAHAVKVRDARLEATIPKGQNYVVLIGGAAKAADVQLKITGH
jgi:hypothetical protein